MQLQLDCDEVVDDSPACHARLHEAVAKRQSLLCDRLNYWSDAFHLIPEGHAVGRRVVRVGLSTLWMPSEEGHPRGELPILDNAVDATDVVKIHHLGFLRKPDAFFRKARVVLKGFFNTYDERLVPLEQQNKPLHEIQNVEWTGSLTPWNGYLPDAVQQWLSARGHVTPNYLPALPPQPERRIKVSKPVEHEPMNVRVCGDLGDIIASMATLKAIGRVRLFACDRGICKPLLSRLHLIKPLLLSQGYVLSVEPHNDEPINWDASDFRTRHRWTQSLHLSHLMHYRSQTHLPWVSPDFRKPWLTGIAPDPRSKGRVIVHRTNRYNNDTFPWKEIATHYGQRLMVVGTPEERDQLCRVIGPAEYAPTADLLEVAKLVAGADLVIAGQSCVLAIAEAMKRPRIAEISPTQPDVLVAVSPEVQYVVDGSVRLPDVAGSGVLHISPAMVDWQNINTSITPPGGWQHPDMGAKPYHFRSAVASLASIKEIPTEEAKVQLLRHNVNRCPEFYINPRRSHELVHYEQAYQNALK